MDHEEQIDHGARNEAGAVGPLELDQQRLEELLVSVPKRVATGGAERGPPGRAFGLY